MEHTGKSNPRLKTPQLNSPTVAYVADATPGMMKMAPDLVDSHSEAGGGPEAVDTLRPRARPTVWPGRRHVPGLVAPRPRGSTRGRMSPAATSPVARFRWPLGVDRYGAPKSVLVPGPAPPRHAPPRTVLAPLCLMGDQGILSRPSPNPARDFRSSIRCYHAPILDRFLPRRQKPRRRRMGRDCQGEGGPPCGPNGRWSEPSRIASAFSHAPDRVPPIDPAARPRRKE
jgi:hypothetical protein